LVLELKFRPTRNNKEIGTQNGVQPYSILSER
jgi:hypothetical protein